MKPGAISTFDAEPAPAELRAALGSALASAQESALREALAAELVRITRDLSDLAYDLGSEPATLRRHMASLQAIDRITQTQLGIADVLRTPGTVAERLAVVTMQDMAERLEAYVGDHDVG